MATATPPPTGARAPKAGIPTWLKIAMGCGGLILLAGLVFVIAACAGVYWMLFPGPQIPTVLVVGPASVGVVDSGDLAADAGAQALLGRFFTEMQKAGDEATGLPPFLRSMRQLQQAQASQAIGQWLPSAATVSFEPGEDGASHAIAAVNFKMYVRPIRAMIERSSSNDRNVKRIQYRNETILSFGSGASICFAGGTLLYSDGVERIRAVLDRAAYAKGTVPSIPSSLAGPPGPWDARGTLNDPTHAVALLALLLSFAQPDSPKAPTPPAEAASAEAVPAVGAATALTSAGFGIDAQSGNRIRALLVLGYPDARQAAAAAAALEPTLGQARERAQAAGMVLATAARVQDRSVNVELQADAIGTAISDWATRLKEKQSRDRGRPSSRGE
jgi:hypothetical protein